MACLPYREMLPISKPAMPPSWNSVTIFARGFLMGAADIVPGVSGGTVALIVGVYERLLTAISRLDGQLLRHLAAGRWRAAATHSDLGFLAALALGVGTGVFSLAGVMHHLLANHREVTFAAFFGLILASGVLVGRMCSPRSPEAAAVAAGIGAAAALAACWLVSRPQFGSGDGLLYVFVCGAVAICAMILPGVSGSYLLVLLGMYERVTGIIKSLPRGEFSGDDLLTAGVFGLGCVVGLLAFCRVLKGLLARAWTPTMAALCGFMIGSLYKVWPFQKLGDTEATELKQQVAAMSPCWPESFDGLAAACLGSAVGAAVFVFAADAIARRAAGGDNRIAGPGEAATPPDAARP